MWAQVTAGGSALGSPGGLETGILLILFCFVSCLAPAELVFFLPN